MKKIDINNLILSNFAKTLEPILKEIAEKHNLNYDDLRKEFIDPMNNKKRTVSKRKGKLNAYTAYLKDKTVDLKIKEEQPNIQFSELSRLKGKMWKELETEEKQRYKDIAKDLNEQAK